MMRMTEAMVRRWVQIPGPSSQAEISSSQPQLQGIQGIQGTMLYKLHGRRHTRYKVEHPLSEQLPLLVRSGDLSLTSGHEILRLSPAPLCLTGGIRGAGHDSVSVVRRGLRHSCLLTVGEGNVPHYLLGEV